jgi:hypothetical protein
LKIFYSSDRETPIFLRNRRNIYFLHKFAFPIATFNPNGYNECVAFVTCT